MASQPGEQQVVVRMPSDLHAAAVARAKAEERSLAQLIRYAIRRYLNTPLAAGAQPVAALREETP